MLKIEDLTVSAVAGIIAAGVFIIHFLIPTIFPLILVGVLNDENSAATWSVTSRALHSSHWPSFLRTDSAGMQGVRRSVRWISLSQTLVAILLTSASIISPLGLYETIMPQKGLKMETFSYAADSTSMGIGTLPRTNDFGPSRACQGILPKICPWSETEISDDFNRTSIKDYDRRVPKNMTEIYSAGLSKLDRTVSSVFDIQWRTYKKVLQSRQMQAGRPYLVGSYRHISQMVLNNAWDVVTGLLVDTKSGGVGFRNHTAPPPLPFGSTWSEELLFIEPETECVDMNITMDFNIPMSDDERATVENLVVTGHGGFANFDKDIPSFDRTNPWLNANLRDRAYFAAWFSNAYTMMYLNVTNPKSKESDTRFQYLNSKVGQRFPINNGGDFEDFEASYDRLIIQGQYGAFMNMGNAQTFGISNSSLHSNPFQVNAVNFTKFPLACSGGDDSRYANISNIAVSCGMVYGAARRKDGSASLLFDPGTEWTVPLYSCASASKASVKAVQFRYNGTEGLQSLDVLSIEPKTYTNDDDKPLWAVENLEMELEAVNHVWGITLPEHANHPNISTARQEYLYLPGMAPLDFDGETVAATPTSQSQNLAGVDFYSRIMAVVYNMDDSLMKTYGLPDYTGRTNMAMYNRWQNLSRNATTAAKIVNLIWTDVSANAVVGTRGQIPSEPLQNLAKRDEPAPVQVAITVFTRRVHFHVYYGIPAFLILALSAIVALTALAFIATGRASPSRMRQFLDQTSAGRILTTFLYTNDCAPGAPRADWIRNVGRKRIDLGGQYPRGMNATLGQPLNSGFASAGFPPSPAGSTPFGKLYEAGISLNNLPSPQQYSPVAGEGGGAASSYYNAQAPQESYTYVAPGDGRLNAHGAGYTEFRTGAVSPIDSKIR